MLTLLIIMVSVKTPSLLVILFLLLILMFVLKLKSMALSLGLYMISIIFVSGLLMMLFYTSVLVKSTKGYVTHSLKFTLGCLLLFSLNFLQPFILMFPAPVLSAEQSYSKHHSSISILMMMIIYFLIILNKMISTVKFMRQIV